MLKTSIFPKDIDGMEMRGVFGQALAIQGEKHSNLVLLGADALDSTRAIEFTNKFPERSFNFGIAEQEMISAASGFALCDKIPVVAAYGYDADWDDPIGLKTEIVPLSRPFGLYAGNVFQGVVVLKGEPVPYAEVEVEYFNVEGRFSAPTDYMVTQTIKADSSGVFIYAVPKAGWWGFAAINTDDRQIKGKDVEIGAVLWVNFHEMK